jgi:hypothetical protein
MAEITFAQVNERGQLIILLSDDRVINVGNVVGPAGATGNQGIPGPKGEPGTDGTEVHLTAGPPGPALGKDGDIAIDAANWVLYKKSSLSWGSGNPMVPSTRNFSGSSTGIGGGGSPGSPQLTPNLTALNDVTKHSSPALGQVPIWTYVSGQQAHEGFWNFAAPVAHLKNWESVVHWESGATVFYNGHIWRATQDNTAVEPILEPGKAQLFIHIPGEPSFAIVPTGISSGPPPSGTQPMGTMKYAYWLQYVDDHTMHVWKFKITGTDPATHKPVGHWEVQGWPTIPWRHPIPPPTKFDPLSVFVWIYDEPGGTAVPIIGQQKWAQIHLSTNLGQSNDVDAPFPQNNDILVYDSTRKKWVNKPQAALATELLALTTPQINQMIQQQIVDALVH